MADSDMVLSFIEVEKYIFQKTSGGFISLTVKKDDGDTVYDRVNFYRAFPLSKPDEYISVRDNEKKEIGIIRRMSDLKDDDRSIIIEDLNRRYFTPEVTAIQTVKDEYGYVYMDILTSSGAKNITIPNGSNNFVRLSEVRLILIDIDGNRFSIVDYTKLDEKSVRLLETLI